jgi:uncharacterized protein
MIKNIWTVLIALPLLVSCATETRTVRYYKLQSISPSENTKVESHSNAGLPEKKGQNFVLIESIKLAEFLRRQGLVIQKSSHQLQVSELHRWAENLESSITRIIIAQLEVNTPLFRFENSSSLWKTKPAMRIGIEIEQFHVNEQRQAVTSGLFRIMDSNRNFLSKRRFSFKHDLSKNGYENAVAQLELSLNELTQLIARELVLYKPKS